MARFLPQAISETATPRSAWVASMDGKGWVKPAFHPLAFSPPSNFHRFSKNRPREQEARLTKAQDESHAFVNHAFAPRVPSPSRRAHPLTLSAQLDVRRHTPTVSTAGASHLRFQSSASAPALHGTPGRARMALRPQPSPPRTASKQPEAATVGPNLAYTNYMALSTPLVRRWVRTPRQPANNAPPAKPGCYAAHESAHPSNPVPVLP